MNKQGANIQYIQNPIDSGIESYEDYEKRIFSKKIIDMSYVNYLKYNKEVITEQII